MLITIDSMSRVVHSAFIEFPQLHPVYAWGSRVAIYSPGACQHAFIDGQTYCDWGIDYLKIDQCGGCPTPKNITWLHFREMFDRCRAATGRDIVESVESCGDPASCGQYVAKTATMWRTGGGCACLYTVPEPNACIHVVVHNCAFEPSCTSVLALESLQCECSLFPYFMHSRTRDAHVLVVCAKMRCAHTGDIQSNWKSVLGNAYTNNRMAAVANSNPGHFNDADMLQVGNVGLSLDEQRSHFAIWCIMGAPLLIGTDIIHASNATVDVLTSRELIAVNQDPGKDGAVQGSAGDGVVVLKLLVQTTRSSSLHCFV